VGLGIIDMKLPNSLSEAGEMAQVASLPTKGEAQSSRLSPGLLPPKKNLSEWRILLSS
jgi:hypothetical protein